MRNAHIQTTINQILREQQKRTTTKKITSKIIIYSILPPDNKNKLDVFFMLVLKKMSKLNEF